MPLQNGFLQLIWGIVLIVQGVIMLVIDSQSREFLTIESLIFVFLGGVFLLRSILFSFIFTFIGIVTILAQNFATNFPLIYIFYKWTAIIAIIAGVIFAVFLSRVKSL